MPRHVLVVVSAADRLPLQGGGSAPTGVYLGELVEPAAALLAAGVRLSFATPGGRAPTLDGTSCSLAYFGFSRAKRDAAFATYARLLDAGLGAPIPLEKLHTVEQYDGLFVPGGHAPLVDLLYRDAHTGAAHNEDFGALLAHFHAAGKPTGLICHAPAALAAAPEEDGRWLYAGYRMTCFKTVVDTMLQTVPVARRFPGRLFEPDPARLLGELGARVEQTRLPMGSKVVIDRELVTGQDPYSARAFGTAFTRQVRAADRAAAGMDGVRTGDSAVAPRR
ncbi:type 1 glutamine amidotransferase domain-containing protein [Nocardia jiangsuensis]|uniref:Type 1 glutamine amidotransferase domain-containing protein n=1 Tax=Nocardia jiangsuensis TaxID=1691563 RepID=A0ABV8DZU1_9NOCA